MPLPRTIATAQHEDFDLRLVAGEWPEDLTGEVVISAPAPKEPEAGYALFTRGHVIRFSLEAGTHGAPEDRWAWRVREIGSPSVRLQDARPDVFSPGMVPGYLSPYGFMNMGNTAPLPWGDRLFATWDVGRPIEVDPVTLEFLGEVGHRDSWGTSMPFPGILPFLFSSAHPVVDPERDCLWTVKLVAGGGFELQPHVVRYDGDGTEVKVWPVADSMFNGTMHTISQTRDYLLLMDSGNFKVDPGEIAGGPRTVLMDEASPLFLVRKEDVEKTPPGRELPMERFMIAPPVGHFYARYDDSDGVQMVFEHQDGIDLGFFLKEDDVDANGNPIDPTQVGLYNMCMKRSTTSEIVLNPGTGKATDMARRQEEWAWNQQLSAIDWSFEGMLAPTLHHVVFQGWRPENVSRRALDAYSDRFDYSDLPGEETEPSLVSFERGALDVKGRWEWTPDVVPSSPIFVPRAPGSDPKATRYAGADPGGHDGYVVVPLLSDDGIRIEVFDAARVGDGPVAAVEGGRVPLMLHSAWMPRAVAAPTDVERLRFGDELCGQSWNGLSDDLKDAARKVADELDAETV